MRTPPSAGPSNRVAVLVVACSAIALGIAILGTTFGTRACRSGRIIVCRTPVADTYRNRCQGFRGPVDPVSLISLADTKIANITAVTANTACVPCHKLPAVYSISQNSRPRSDKQNW